MGNKAAKEFNDTFDEVKTFVERNIRQGKNNKGISLGREYVDQDNDIPLFQIDDNKDSEDDPTVVRSVASDADGCILYADKVTVNKDNQKQVMIYKTSPVFPGQRPAKDMRISKGDPNNVYLAAVIFHNQQGAASYLCTVIGENRFDDTGFELQDLYKAMKNPIVLKNGIVVADMEGHVLGKVTAARSPRRGSQLLRSSSSSSCASASSVDSSQSCNSGTLSSSFSSFLSSMGEKKATRYEVAAGAEAAAVIAVASSLFN